MNPTLARTLIIIGGIGVVLYVLYMSLPYLITLASNILYLSFVPIIFIVLIVVIYNMTKKK